MWWTNLGSESFPSWWWTAMGALLGGLAPEEEALPWLQVMEF